MTSFLRQPPICTAEVGEVTPDHGVTKMPDVVVIIIVILVRENLKGIWQVVLGRIIFVLGHTQFLATQNSSCGGDRVSGANRV